MGITPQQFKRLEERLNRSSRMPVPVFDPAPRSRPIAGHEIVLGLDPSLRGTGYGIIRIDKPHPATLAQGTISCPASWEMSRCLARIASALREVVREHKPGVCVVEGVFFAQNLKTAIIMGQARGAALSVVAEAGLDVYEIATRKVKQAIVGYGAAQKAAVAKMVQRMLRLAEPPAPDAADALALALTHVQEHSRFSLNSPRKI